jgi:hypothetical protein
LIGIDVPKSLLLRAKEEPIMGNDTRIAVDVAKAVFEGDLKSARARGLLRELGLFIPVGPRQVVPAVWMLIEDADSDLPDPLRSILVDACEEVRQIETRIKLVERQLEATALQLPVVALLFTASACSPPLHSSPSSATSAASPRDDTWPATSGSPPGSSPAVSTPTRSHLQARRRLPAHTPDPRCALGPAPRQTPYASPRKAA